VYTAKWEVPLSARLGRYRFVITAKRYRIRSEPFTMSPSRALEAKLVTSGNGRAFVQLEYPKPVVNVDLTYRPGIASGGTASFRVNDKPTNVKSRKGGLALRGRPGDEVALPAGAARDRYGNRTKNALGFSL